MKILSLLEPWASLVALGKKKFETRSWKTKHRGRMGIHASKSFRTREKNLILNQPLKGALKNLCFRESALEGDRGKNIFAFTPERLPLGAIIATCDLVDIYLITETELIQIDPPKGQEPKRLPLPTGDEYDFGDYAPGRYAWELADVAILPEPIQAKGRLGLWNFDLEAK